MNEFLSPHASSVLLGDAKDRQCTARNRDGTRCGRASALGAFVCNLHGAKSPLSQQAAKERLLMLQEPALEVLYRATRSAPPCPHCGRSDADRDPVAVRAAQLVLDRCGLGPQATVTVQPAPNPYEHLTIDETIIKLEDMLASARQLRDQRLAHLASTNHVQIGDDAIDADAFVIPDDEPIQDEAARFPLGTRTPEASTAETPEKPEENEADHEPR